MLTEKEILKMAKDCDIPLCGCTSSEPLNDWLDILLKRKAKGRITSFERTLPQKRVDYLDTYDQTQGVIVIGIPYGVKMPLPKDFDQRGKIATVAWGMDYHQIVSQRLDALLSTLKKCYPLIDGRCYVDNSHLLDRASAWRAGLGFFGKNNTLINDQYGSFFFIGQLLINQPIALEEKSSSKSRCGNCTLCLRACPNGALHKGYTMETERCISYLTQKKKLKNDETALLGTCYLYGCDECQLVCPFNQIALKTLPKGDVEVAFVYPFLKDIDALSSAEFEKHFGQTAAAWRGREIIVRNAGIIKNNRKNHAKDKN